MGTFLSTSDLWPTYCCPFPTHIFVFPLFALPNLNKVLGIFTLANFFLKKKAYHLPYEELHNFGLSGPLVFPMFVFLIHEINDLKHFELEFQSNITTFQTPRQLGNLIPELSSRFARALSHDSSISLPNAPSPTPLSLESIGGSKSS